MNIVTKLISASELMTKEIPPINWIVPGLLPEGLSILAGKPKSGKSLFALNLAISVSTGSSFLSNFKSNRNSVLYVAYEDNERRIKDRLSDMLSESNSETDLSQLFFFDDFKYQKLDIQGFEQLKNIVDENPTIKLIIIDTLGSAVSGSGKNLGMSYLEDYDLWSKFQKFALNKRLSFLFIHHTRKMKADYVFDEISGTRGLTGAAGVNIVLESKPNISYLHTQGRDIEESKYEIKLDKDTLTWQYIGEKSGLTISPERQEIINLLSDIPGNELKAKEISEKLSKDSESTRQLLSSMKHSGELFTGSKYGYYKLNIN
jgi:RecA-family ATPase